MLFISACLIVSEPLAQQGAVKSQPGPLELEALSEFMARVDPAARPQRRASRALHP